MGKKREPSFDTCSLNNALSDFGLNFGGIGVNK